MCNPAIALVAVTVASTAASMYSQSKQAKYQSAIACLLYTSDAADEL